VEAVRAEGRSLPRSRERRPLLDTEPMLLVDHRDRERAELDALLDQRVRPDGNRGLARCDRGPRRRVLPRGQRARDEHDRDAERGAEPLDRQGVLLGEDLGRRHQRPLMALLDRAQERVEGDGRLSGAHVALQQTLHRRRGREVAVDLGDRALLLGGQRERQCRPVPGDELAARRARAPGQTGGVPAAREPAEREQPRRPAASAPPGLLECRRTVDCDERVGPERQAEPLAHPGGERIPEGPGLRQRLLDEAPDSLGGQRLARWVHGRHPGQRLASREIVIPDVEPPSLERTAQRNPRARAEPLEKPRRLNQIASGASLS
jgi:hypothetical protein